MADRVEPDVRRLILVPAAITLAVTLLRLAGELLHWSPELFSREAGGGGAFVGIVWLIPPVGAWLGYRLAAAGDTAHAGRAFAWALAGFLLNVGLGFAAFATIKGPIGQLAAFTATSWIALLVARPGWPALWRVLTAYAFAARLPVLALMFASIFLGWDTHYAKPRPDFPPMGPAGLFFWTALLPQLSIWIWMTVAGGMLFGAPAAALRRKIGGGQPAERAAAA